MLSPQAQGLIARQPRLGPWVFPSRHDASRLRPFDLPLWRVARRQAGLENVRLHDLRHTFASHAVLRGVPLPVVSGLIGHANPRMTLRYAHVNDREKVAAAERIGVAIEAFLSKPALVMSNRQGDRLSARRYPTGSVDGELAPEGGVLCIDAKQHKYHAV